MAHAAARTFSVFLVITFSFVEWSRLSNVGHDGVFKIALGCYRGSFCNLLLFFIEVKNGSAIAITNIRTLTIELGRIMHSKELHA